MTGSGSILRQLEIAARVDQSERLAIVTGEPALARQARERHGDVIEVDRSTRPQTLEFGCDVCLVASILEHLDKTLATQILARIAHHLTRHRTLVAIDNELADDPWTLTEFTALGFDRIEGGRDPVAVYRFELASYKQRPTWLNSDHWANPERWDKERW